MFLMAGMRPVWVISSRMSRAVGRKGRRFTLRIDGEWITPEGFTVRKAEVLAETFKSETVAVSRLPTKFGVGVGTWKRVDEWGVWFDVGLAAVVGSGVEFVEDAVPGDWAAGVHRTSVII
jgi:hypothetical protein